MSDDLRNEVLKLIDVLNSKKRQLFLDRLEVIACKKLNQSNISEVLIEVSDNKWQITYTHITDKYHVCNYNIAEFDDNDVKSNNTIYKKSTITFGQTNNKYYIKGGIKLNIYRNTGGDLRIINPEYEFELDLDEQMHLVKDYSENIDIPEWLAIKTFLYLAENKWDDLDIINHLSVV